jgi:hypothetical protein
MKHGLIAGIAAIAVALALGALLANWERGPGAGDTAMPNLALQDGRAATATDPAVPMPPAEPDFPKTLTD